MQGAALPLELDELIRYIGIVFNSSEPNICVLDANEPDDDQDMSNIRVLAMAEDIDDYVICDEGQSDFLRIQFWPYEHEVCTLLADSSD